VVLTNNEEKEVGFENKVVLRRIFRPERMEVTGRWGSLHIEELHNLYCSQNITVIKSRRM
jgi:hypothetical protein